MNWNKKHTLIPNDGSIEPQKQYERIHNSRTHKIQYLIQSKKKNYQLGWWAKFVFYFRFFISFCDSQPNLVFGMPILFEFDDWLSQKSHKYTTQNASKSQCSMFWISEWMNDW